MHRNRAFFSHSFCGGKGIEIGALHHPTPLPPGAQVRYVDRLPVEGLRKQYPELAGEDLVPVHILDSGETLATLPDGREDFAIAAQFIEHCQNPVRALVNMLRVVRPEGFVMLTVPDKRYSFDKDRPITTHEHLLDECLNGTEHTRRDHFREWVLAQGERDEEQVEKSVDQLMERDYSIHYHVWDSDAFLKFLFFAKERFGLPFELWASCRNGTELVTVLRKSVP
ncbi:MAG TPA: methyltransferase domain-containing protein [Fibrobacteria bacterium]|nr:methyltransferase domain-containing protein [Fibrobacteria bacterium]